MDTTDIGEENRQRMGKTGRILEKRKPCEKQCLTRV